MADDREHAKELIDRLPPAQLAAVVHLLGVMPKVDPEGDMLSPAERDAVSESVEWLKQNDGTPHETVLSDLGVTTDDWERMCSAPAQEEVFQHDG
ncbi:MAG TPA: hypothetical protein VN736_21730 [Candidatus Limnocylindrales bacterium]|nr:hypothetical protein [Candidatus Limnocylindrales bacterium]